MPSSKYGAGSPPPSQQKLMCFRGPQHHVLCTRISSLTTSCMRTRLQPRCQLAIDRTYHRFSYLRDIILVPPAWLAPSFSSELSSNATLTEIFFTLFKSWTHALPISSLLLFCFTILHDVYCHLTNNFIITIVIISFTSTVI